MAPMKRPAANGLADQIDPSCSVTQLARRWHTRRHRIRSLLQQGILPFIQVRGRIRIPLSAVHSYERRFASD